MKHRVSIALLFPLAQLASTASIPLVLSFRLPGTVVSKTFSCENQQDEV